MERTVNRCYLKKHLKHFFKITCHGDIAAGFENICHWLTPGGHQVSQIATGLHRASALTVRKMSTAAFLLWCQSSFVAREHLRYFLSGHGRRVTDTLPPIKSHF